MPLPASIATALAALKTSLKAATKTAIRDPTTVDSVTRAAIANADDRGLDYTDQVVAALFDSNGLLRADLLPTGAATTTPTSTPTSTPPATTPPASSTPTTTAAGTYPATYTATY